MMDIFHDTRFHRNHALESNRQYTLMLDAVRQRLKGSDPVHLSVLTGFHWSGTSFETETLGKPIHISWPDCRIMPAVDLWHDLTILQYLANTQGTALTGKFISMSEFCSGGMARGTSFDRENDRTISCIGQFPASSIREAASRLGGIELPGKSDLAFHFSFLPRIPVILNLWLADEEFPASGKVLFDSSAEQDLQVEAAGTVSGVLLSLLWGLLIQ